jgi:hypothetical protein
LNWLSTIVDHSFVDGPSTVTAGGSGYLERGAPDILVNGLNAQGEFTSFTIGTLVASGAVVGIVPGVLTISSITSTAVVPPNRINALAGGVFGLNALGQLLSVSLDNTGKGYSDTPAPTVTVRGLRGGSGAVVTAEIDEQDVVALNIVNRGSGYFTATSNFPTTPQAFSQPSALITLVAGQERVLDAYYGTGRRLRDVQ